MKNYGYKKTTGDDTEVIQYINNIDEGYSFYNEFKVFAVMCNGTCAEINIALLQAINEKVKELGWEE